MIHESPCAADTAKGEKSPLVLFLGNQDFGNSAFMFGKALESIGWNVEFALTQPHSFKYPEEGYDPGFRWDFIHERIEAADVVHIVQSDLPFPMGGEHPPPEFRRAYEDTNQSNKFIRGADGRFHRIRQPHDPSHWTEPGINYRRREWLEYLKTKRLVVQHGGSAYRLIPEFYNDLWNGVADAAIVHGTDLHGLGADNAHFVVPPVDTEMLTPDFGPRDSQITVGHFPGSFRTKGSPEIMEVCRSFQDSSYNFSFQFSGHNPDTVDKYAAGAKTVPWPKHIARMRDCDVIIDQIKPTLDGKPFGAWCSTATEAAALGCIVIANEQKAGLYESTYGGSLGIHVCNDMEDLRAELIRLSCLPRAEIDAERKESREWAKRCHSIEATGKHLQEHVYGPLVGRSSAGIRELAESRSG